jgi:small subunit ribosomal protein S7e
VGGRTRLTRSPRRPQALFDLEATNAELKADLRDLYITSAKEIDIPGTQRKAIIVHVSRRSDPLA